MDKLLLFIWLKIKCLLPCIKPTRLSKLARIYNEGTQLINKAISVPSLV